MQTPEPTELIHPQRASWVPAIAAASAAVLTVGLFTWYPFAIIGGAVALFAARSWVLGSIAEVARLPQRQRLSTSPIPLTGVARQRRRESA